VTVLHRQSLQLTIVLSGVIGLFGCAEELPSIAEAWFAEHAAADEPRVFAEGIVSTGWASEI
jgi:hypothetical protein